MIFDPEEAEQVHVYLQDRLLREYLSFPKKDKRAKSYRDIDLAQDMPDAWRAKFHGLHEEYENVFSSPADGTVTPFAGVEPVEFQFKEGTKPFRCPMPRFTDAQTQVLYPYFDKLIKAGLAFHNPSARTCNRPHIALKQVHGESKMKFFAPARIP